MKTLALRRQRERLARQTFVWGLLIGAVIVGCGDDGPTRPYDACRYDPASCRGEVGAFCRDNRDCAQGTCCTEDSNCGGGMCTFACDRDEHCPPSMACEHHVCFFRCVSDRDCAVGQSCEHGKTVCEWP